MNYLSNIITIYNLTYDYIDYERTYEYIKDKSIQSIQNIKEIVNYEMELLTPEEINETEPSDFIPTTNLEDKSTKIIKTVDTQIRKKKKNNQKGKRKMIEDYKKCIDREEESYDIDGDILII
jgi:DNA replication protein DnaD